MSSNQILNFMQFYRYVYIISVIINNIKKIALHPSDKYRFPNNVRQYRFS